MKKLLIATTNPGKLNEIKSFLKDLPLELVSLTDLGISQRATEDGVSFEENSLKKANFYAQISHLPTIADDGGLEIDYLKGEPGVKSRRWINGLEASDEELINFTLKKLKGLPLKNRKAQLRAVLALVLPDGEKYLSEGKIRGIIAVKPYNSKRTAGFPFRSLLYLPGLKKFYNEDDLTEEENLKYNHRGKALVKLKKIIKKLLI